VELPTKTKHTSSVKYSTPYKLNLIPMSFPFPSPSEHHVRWKEQASAEIFEQTMPDEKL